MSSMTTNAISPANLASQKAILRSAAHWTSSRLRQARRWVAQKEELQRLSARMLRDIGLRETDVARNIRLPVRFNSADAALQIAFRQCGHR